MNWKTNCTKLPNQLLKDDQINCSVRQVGAALYSCQINGKVSKSMKEISILAGVRSVTTVETAIDRLVDTGYIIETIPNHYYSKKHGRYVNSSNSYILDMSFPYGFTLIPRSLFSKCYGEYSSFVVAAGIRCIMGNKTRAWPSLKEISEVLGIAISTICRAIKYLVTTKVLYCQHCIKQNRAFSKNSYYFLQASACYGDNISTHGTSISDTAVCVESENALCLPEYQISEPQLIFSHVSIIHRLIGKINILLRRGVLSNLVNKELRLR